MSAMDQKTEGIVVRVPSSLGSTWTSVKGPLTQRASTRMGWKN